MKLFGLMILYLLSFFALFASTFLIKGCGTKKEEKIVIKQDSCEGIPLGKTRVLECPKGYDGNRLEVCQKKGWVEIENECLPTPNQCDVESSNLVTFERDIKPIIIKSCAVGGCHITPNPFTEFENFKRVINEAIDLIGESDGFKMPPSPRPQLPIKERELIEKWKSDGLIKDNECAEKDAFGNPFIYMDEDFELDVIKKDALRIDNTQKQQQTIWLTLTHKYNLRPTKEEFEQFERAIIKGANALSTQEYIVIVSPANLRKTVYRLDLIELNLDRDLVYQTNNPGPYVYNIAVPGRERQSKKGSIIDMIIDASPFAFESNKDDARLIKELTGRKIFSLKADDFLFIAHGTGDIYYKILDVGRNKQEFLQNCGIDEQQRFDDFEFNFLVTDDSLLGNQNRLVTRTYATRSRLCKERGAYYETYDTAAPNGDQTKNLRLFPFPQGVDSELIFNHDAGEGLFPLPNGLIGGILFNNQGVLQTEAPIEVVVDYKNPFSPVIVANLSCLRCHGQGYLPLVDTFLEGHVPANFNLNDRELIKAYYKSAIANSNNFVTDNKAFQAALKTMGVDPNKEDPVNFLVDRLRYNYDQKKFCAFWLLELDECLDKIRGSDIISSEIGQLLISNGTIGLNQLADSADNIIKEFRIGEEEIDD